MGTDRHGSWSPGLILLTCEHAGNEVPPEYRSLFTVADAELTSHRGWDLGALWYAQRLAVRLHAPLLACIETRLLVEANRSPDHPELFSRFSRGLSESSRREILERWYWPHRRRVEQIVRLATDSGTPVLHLAAHSFTDVLDGLARDVDIGLLFDPDRQSESGVCAAVADSLRLHAPDLRTRFNEPYHGTDDGLTTWLRARFAPDLYAGIEIELRQGLLRSEAEATGLADLLVRALSNAGQIA